ncbi:MAG: hypothetical protein NZ958_02110 [Bacteroidia bacterium]|nr:hypothetical protein [Bacteroidia bacterium]MDW8089138.1 hypothetical protein [Bacteroidia bacterium]
MNRGFWSFLGLLLGWAQDTVRVLPRLWGDYVELAVEWRGTPGQVPVGANFVLTGTPEEAVGWTEPQLVQRGPRDGAISPLYFPLYFTHRLDGPGAFRLSLNLLAKSANTGLPFSGQWESVGIYHLPIRRFQDTLRLAWGMETGEIVLAGLGRARHRFVFAAIPPLPLCPSFHAPLRIRVHDDHITLDSPELAYFRPENLEIHWYWEDRRVAEGPYCPLIGEGGYYAVVRHRCGRIAHSDTLLWRSASLSSQKRGGWRLYPQPTNGILWVEAPSTGPVELVLCEASGREVWRTTWEAQAQYPYALRLPLLPAGLYTAYLRSSAGVTSTLIAYVP